MDILDLTQGSPEWHSLRKLKITATDAAVIMGVSPWKTKAQLYKEKLSDEVEDYKSPAMQRGLELEPHARELFAVKTGIETFPAVVVKDIFMASLDGLSLSHKEMVEIKCPGKKDHSIAQEGRIPEHYYPQLQHQMYVTGLHQCYYFSFDGTDGVILIVKRDDSYIEQMVQKELEFYESVLTRTPPKEKENFIQRDDQEWYEVSSKWKIITSTIKDLERQEEEVRKRLIELCGESSCLGYGVSVTRIQRKGSVDYSRIPELKGVDLSQYKKEDSFFWKICDTTREPS